MEKLKNSRGYRVFMIIGITGSFGSGKTTVANMFKRYRFKVIDVDKVYHKDFYKNHQLRNKIKKEFGTLDRIKLKKIVFSDYSRLKRLNKITHPIIIKTMKKEIKNANKKSSNYKNPIIKKIPINKKTNKNKIRKKGYNENYNEIKIIVDIPLLFEAKLEKLFDKIIVVKADKKTQINRILKKKKYSKKEIEQIIKSQMPLKEKIKKADFVVDNNKDKNYSEKQIRNIVASVMQKP